MVFAILLIIMLFVDIYSFKGIRILTENLNSTFWRKFVYIAFWATTALMIVAMISGYFFRNTTRNPATFTWYYYLFGLFLIFYVPKMLFGIFHLAEDIIYGVSYIFQKIVQTKSSIADTAGGEPISRLKFISQTGLVLATIPFVSFIWGIVRGRFNFQVESVSVGFENLPKNFNGLKVVHISDIHIGSFHGFKGQVEDAIDMINAQKPDLIFFTGDLVNNFYEELNGFTQILGKMEARYGKYSILGNHDYGHYYHWKTKKEERENFAKIQHAHAEIGFKLLNNSTEVLEIDGEKIAIVGVENWGLPPFPQIGDYKKATEGVEDIPFKVLLSHDPTHWDEKIIGKTDVALTLSGHTHGMQFGIQVGNIKWSPSQYKYPRWSGLYREANQYLYVNRGFGYIGYPGRVGMPPEITLLNFHTV
jgi:predicted MPP superfamily phosphohydrolase